MLQKNIFSILAIIISVNAMNSFHLEYLINVMEKFEKFSFIVHFDTPNAFIGNHLLSEISHSKPTFIASYNASHASYASLRRPAGIQFVHLVLLDDPCEFSKHLAVYGNVILYHTVVFVVQHVENFEYEFWELKHLKFAGKVLIVNMSSSEEISVYKKCYYCGVYAGFLDAIEFKHSNQPNASVSELTQKTINPSSFLRLHGQFLRIGHNEFFPYLYCRGTYHNDSYCDDLAGAEWKLLQVLAQKLNFSYSMVGGEYDVFEHVLNNTADIIIGGVSINFHRFTLVTFSKFIRYEDLNFLYFCHISIWQYLKLYFIPFQFLVWFAVFTMFLVISCFIKFSVRVEGINFSTSLLVRISIVYLRQNSFLCVLDLFAVVS